MEELARISWLFVRGEETIRVNYNAATLSIAASGPGHHRRIFKFGDEQTAAEFLKLHEHFLAAGGWALQAFVERRSEQVPTVPLRGAERRRRPDSH